MSRIGKKPIPMPKGVTVKIGEALEVKGPKGTLTVPLPSGIEVRDNSGTLELTRKSDQYAALHGLTRALAANAVTGVSTGFTRELDIVGIGYRAGGSEGPGRGLHARLFAPDRISTAHRCRLQSEQVPTLCSLDMIRNC